MTSKLRERIREISLHPIKLINDGVVNPSGYWGLSDDKIDAILLAIKEELNIKTLEQNDRETFGYSEAAIAVDNFKRETNYILDQAITREGTSSNE